MQIRVTLTVNGREAAADTFEMDDGKLEPLGEDEREAAVEVAVRSWADRNIAIAWETVDEPEPAE